jgi:hypothetical protein
MQLLAALTQCEIGSTVFKSDMGWEMLPINELVHVSSQVLCVGGRWFDEEVPIQIEKKPSMYYEHDHTHGQVWSPLWCVRTEANLIWQAS